MATPPEKPHWQGRRRFVEDGRPDRIGRMAWYGEAGDEHYWYEYWKARLTPDYYATAEALSVQEDELGRVLLASMPRSGRCLEAGCGAGYWVAALRQRGIRIEGIEYARELVELVRAANPGLPVSYGDALAVDCPDSSYDSYLSIGVVEHRNEGPEPFLSEAYRVLKPGGSIVIAVPYFGAIRALKSKLLLYERQRPALPFFQYGFSAREFSHILRQAGFRVTYAQPLYAHRLLQEELPGYDRLAERAPFVRRIAERLLYKRDGHMLLVVGQKLERMA